MPNCFKWPCYSGRCVVAVIVVLLMGGGHGCVLLPRPEPLEPFTPRQWPQGSYQTRVDHFVVLFDASDSMNERYRGWRKFDYAKEVVRRINLTLPPLTVQGGLRAFGSSTCLSGQRTLRVYGMSTYSARGLRQGLESIPCAGGLSPLAAAMLDIISDLDAATGPIAVIIVSDGDETGPIPAVEAARQLQMAFEKRPCLYAIQIGDDARGAEVLERITRISGCGFALNGDDILGSEAMAAFVQRVFLGGAAAAVADSIACAQRAQPRNAYSRGNGLKVR